MGLILTQSPDTSIKDTFILRTTSGPSEINSLKFINVKEKKLEKKENTSLITLILYSNYH